MVKEKRRPLSVCSLLNPTRKMAGVKWAEDWTDLATSEQSLGLIQHAICQLNLIPHHSGKDRTRSWMCWQVSFDLHAQQLQPQLHWASRPHVPLCLEVYWLIHHSPCSLQASQRIIHGPIYGLAGFISLALKRVTLSTLLWWQIQKIMNRTGGKCRSYLNRANYNPEISYLFERWWKHSIRVASRWFYKPKRIHRTMHGLHYSGWICNKFESLVSTWRVVSPSGF